jgi:hypothetical protein
VSRGTVRHEETNNMGEPLRSNFNGHILFILVRDILNNEEFVGCRTLLNEFECELRMNWIIRIHHIYSVYQSRRNNVIIFMFESVHDQMNIFPISVTLIEANEKLLPPDVVECTVLGGSKSASRLESAVDALCFG